MERHHKLTENIVNDFPSARFYLNFHTDKRFGKLSFLQLQDQKNPLTFRKQLRMIGKLEDPSYFFNKFHKN